MEKWPIVNSTFSLTQECNLRCAYCFTHGKSNKKMSLDTGKRCVDFLIHNAKDAELEQLPYKKRLIDICFWGGEPLLEWELLKQITLYAETVSRENAIFVNFGGTTNGTLLTPDKIPFLKDHNVSFMISLDGGQKTHNWYRKTVTGKGSHTTIMKNMVHILKAWPNCRVRMSPFPERIDNFYNDAKYLFEHGVTNFMFSPVYENNWTKDTWDIWEKESYKVVDLVADYRKKGIRIEIEHFKSYQCGTVSDWPCGAGRFYVGFDADGAIYPCHRFIKFNDDRDWREKETCFGHVDCGITRPEFRKLFIDFFNPESCKDCESFTGTPCHGGCYALNYDLMGDVRKHPDKECEYVSMQKKVSEYYKDKIGREDSKLHGCVCRNMCYLENTPEEIKNIDDSGRQCICDFHANYTGSLDPSVARPLELKTITPQEVMDLLRKLEARVKNLEEK